MAIYSDMQSFPESGMPVLKNNKGNAKADSLAVTDAISIVAGNSNNLGSIGKSNTFTNGAAGSNSFMAGNSNTLNLTGTANKGVIYGTNNIVTLATGESQGIALGTGNTFTGTNGMVMGINNSGSGCINIGISNTGNGTNIGRTNFATGFACGTSNQGIGTSLGDLNTASGITSVCLGYLNTTSGIGATALGSENTVTADYAYSLGAYNGASGYLSLSVGLAAYATATNAAIFGYAPNSFNVTNSTSDSLMVAYEGTNFLLDANKIIANKPVVFKDYTVATLPAGTNNMRAFVTDALAPVFGVAVVGGGAVRIPVYYDGAWKVG